jgi:hypothetical protein
MSALVETVVDMPMDFTAIALNPLEMEKAQRSLILWCARKIQSVKEEAKEANEQLEQAITNKWNSSGWKRQCMKLDRKAEFYRKIKAALEAGYYIVPPFPIDIFAIRTKAETPKAMTSGHRDNHDQLPQVLSIGEGRYVDPKPVRESYVTSESDHKGGSKQVTKYWASEFSEFEFPFKLARGEILQATHSAMQKKIFDQMGVLPRTRAPDPVVCGQILYPDQKLYRFGQNKAVTFFVAWWLDTRTL